MFRDRRTAWRSAAALLLPLLLLLAGCGKSDSKPEAKADEHAGESEKEHTEEGRIADVVELSPAAISEAGIETWKVEPVDLEHLLFLNGTVHYDENRFVQVGATVEGRVASIPVDLGATVRQGDPLVWIESAELGRLRQEYLRAVAELRIASRSYERAKTLVEGKAISRGEYMVREGDYLSKQAAADSAARSLELLGESRADIEKMREQIESGREVAGVGVPRLAVRAPFAGTVIERKVTPGTLVEDMQPLVSLADLSRLWVFVQVYEKDLSLIKLGLPLRIRAEAYPEHVFLGRVDFLGSLVDEGTRSVRVRATVNNPERLLRPGMFVKAQVEVPKPQTEKHLTLAVPQSALQTLEGRTNVFVQTAPGHFARRVVEIGHTFEGFTEVLSGIKAGELVVTEGSFVLKSEFARAQLAEDH